jgi:proline iminopeptidase
VIDPFPAIEPFAAGRLAVGGHELYWERCGREGGLPAVFLHGGPGSGCHPRHRRLFDPAVYDVLLFDQRGAGRSRPLASEPVADLTGNTTADLVADIERLRGLAGHERWTVAGVSWGSTLALAYATRHPAHVAATLLALVTTTSRAEVRWITEGVGAVFPAAWSRFSGAVPARLRHLPLVEAYAVLLADPDPAVCEAAAREWCRWEDAHVSGAPGHRPDPRYDDPAFRLGFARLVTHYWRNAAFLEDGALLRGAASLGQVPAILLAGRHDVSTPLGIAEEVAAAWPGAELRVLDDAGHGGTGFDDAIRVALADLAARG